MSYSLLTGADFCPPRWRTTSPRVDISRSASERSGSCSICLGTYIDDTGSFFPTRYVKSRQRHHLDFLMRLFFYSFSFVNSSCPVLKVTLVKSRALLFDAFIYIPVYLYDDTCPPYDNSILICLACSNNSGERETGARIVFQHSRTCPNESRPR